MKKTRFKKIAAVSLIFLTMTVPALSQVNSPAKAAAEAQPEKRMALEPGMPFVPKKIEIAAEKETLDERLERMITLDVREMNVVDVLKFLALKGNYNLVTSAAVQGRVTLFLKNVAIRDVLDIVLISNGLAYNTDKEIVYVMTEAEYQQMYGKKFNDKNIVKIAQLNYVKPDYVISALDNIKSSMGRIIVDEDTGSIIMIDTPSSIERMTKTIKEIEMPLEPVVYTLQYSKAADVLGKFQARIDANSVGSVSIDERTNKIVVRAFPGRRLEIEKLIKDLDVPTKEVLIEARVLQVVFKPQMDYGIDWNLDFGNLNFSNVLLNESGLSTNNDMYLNYGKIGIGDVDMDGFDLRVRALKQVSDTKILSNPKLLVTNNEEARIHVGDTVPYIISTTSGTGENAITSEEVQFVDVGLKLSVLPVINDDGFITMTLKPELSTVVSKITSQGGGIPQVNKTLVETTVMVKDGTTVVMGGLKKDNKVHVTKGIPLLMDLPLLGNLFKSVADDIESTEIVIFITPHIIKGDEKNHDFYRGEIKNAREYGNDKKMKLKPRLGLKP